MMYFGLKAFLLIMNWHSQFFFLNTKVKITSLFHVVIGKTPKITNTYFVFSFRPLRAELDQWAQSLEKPLTYESGVSAFQQFLKSEFCEENIEFWLVCEDFKQTKTPDNLIIKSKSIYEEFIRKDSPKEVNLDFHTRGRIIQHLPRPSLNCFDEAQRKIY
uniref:Regulator of G protein signaling 2 n=1 Tax=Electrophorus electricus TaxID=8005 RepID=A0A4W4GLW5_ELEEL